MCAGHNEEGQYSIIMEIVCMRQLVCTYLAGVSLPPGSLRQGWYRWRGGVWNLCTDGMRRVFIAIPTTSTDCMHLILLKHMAS